MPLSYRYKAAGPTSQKREAVIHFPPLIGRGVPIVKTRFERPLAAII